MSAAAQAPALAAAVEVEDVSVERHDELLLWNLERPRPGERVEGFYVPLAGWALARDGERVEIQVENGREEPLLLATRVPREDVAAAYPDIAGSPTAGFSLAMNVARLPQEFALTVSVRGRGFAVPVARIKGRRRGFEPVCELPLAPLTVTTLGRTGSTMLLTLLSLHPSIAALEPVAHDSRPFAYCLDAATALAAPSSRLRLVESVPDVTGWWLGCNPVTLETLQRVERPIHDLLVGHGLERVLRSGLRRASEFAHELACANGHEGARYAAEKCSPGYLPGLLRELSEDAREIFLVRDFRDVFASMLAFNAKRGYATFGRERVSTDEEFLRCVCADVEGLAASWVKHRERSLLVRYEELIEDPRATLMQVFDYLGLECSRAQVESIVTDAHALLDSTLSQHRTTPGVSASRGRWRSDLAPADQERCTAAFGHALREFGYL